MPPILVTRAVELDLAGRRDLVAVVDVAAAPLEQLECERQAGRRASDLSEVEADVEREVDVEGLDRQDADDRALRLGDVARRLDRDVVAFAGALEAQAHGVADALPLEDRPQLLAVPNRLAVGGDDHVAGLEDARPRASLQSTATTRRPPSRTGTL